MDRRDLNLTYPCRWDYHVIGEDEHRLRVAVAGIVGNVEYVLSLANRSKRGRYLSLHLTLVVSDEEHRLRLFDELRKHTDVRYVL
jgi:putative lipoic acid-binding regulatory protein